MSSTLRVFRYIRRYPWMAAGTLGCAVASTVMVVVFPGVVGRITNDVVKGNNASLLLPLILVGFGAFFLQNLLNAVRIVVNNTFEQRVIFDLRSDLYAHIQRLPLPWFDDRATGDVMTRLVEDVTSMERVLIDGIEQGIVAVLQIAVIAIAMIYFDPWTALVAAAPIPLMIAGVLSYTLTARTRYRKQRKAASAMNSILHDNLAGIRQIKTYANEEREHERFNTASRNLADATLTVMHTWAVYNPAMTFLNSAGLVAVVGFSAWRVMSGAVEPGTLASFLLLAPLLYEPISRLHGLNQIFQAGRAAADRVFEIMDAPEEPGNDTGEILEKPLKGDVRYESVGFSYTGNTPTLTDVSLHASPGETIALVGSTGAGKSTLVSLLVRFYEKSSGRILLDGRPIESIAKKSLRESIAMVTQESFLFNGTAAENLRLGKPDATEPEMWSALEAANAADFIRRLPEGLHAQLGERGVKLSVGEKQRLSIARALLKNPPILILDEATASVDTTTERLIQAALDHLMAHRTSFVIAHRLSTVRHADQILVLDRGSIVERGRHEELLERRGLYHRLCRNNLLVDERGAGNPLMTRIM